MKTSQLYTALPISRRSVKEALLPRLTREEWHELETGNLWMSYRIALIVGVLETFSLGVALLGARGAQAGPPPVLWGTVVCLCACAVVLLVIRLWEHRGCVSSRRVHVLTELFYWVLSVWGMRLALYHYAAGEQMLVFDSVQICFALMLNCSPLHSLIHIVGSYGALYLLLLRCDGAAMVQGLNYFVLAALLWSSYVLHFRKELLTIRLQAAQRSQILDLESASSHDALTGLKNRHALRQDFPNYVGRRLWVVMADIDYFKQYNDSFGHAVGDRFLAEVGASIRERFGEQYRYGGDEFLLFVEGADEAQVLTKLRQWEDRVAQISVETERERVTPRCSYGVSGGLIRDEGTLRCHIRQADQRLYQVKGRRGE